MKRWFRRVLRRCGIDVPFTDVVCPQHVKTIRVQEDARIEVVDRRSLVFLDLPESDDLRDVLPINTYGESAPYLSPDAFELHRAPTRKGTQVYWMPREPIVQYALYAHQYGWMSQANPVEAVVCSEFRCEMRTGMVDLELITAGRFETAVAFKRPRWRRLSTESGLIKYALKQLESEGERPVIADDGARLVWKLLGPKVGECYVYVAFEENGVKLWRERLEAKSLAGRMRRLITRPLPSA
jgi:hypothetical protein